jgi:hypothetical protein
MQDSFTLVEAMTLAEIIVYGDVSVDTLTRISDLNSTSQRRAIEELYGLGIFEYTRFQYE